MYFYFKDSPTNFIVAKRSNFNKFKVTCYETFQVKFCLKTLNHESFRILRNVKIYIEFFKKVRDILKVVISFSYNVHEYN